jgi:hypothetical protein
MMSVTSFIGKNGSIPMKNSAVAERDGREVQHRQEEREVLQIVVGETRAEQQEWQQEYVGPETDGLHQRIVAREGE